MTRLFKVIFVSTLLFVLLTPLVSNAQNNPIQYVIEQVGGVQYVNFTGSGFDPLVEITVKRGALKGSCEVAPDNTRVVGITFDSGAFSLLDPICAGVFQYEFSIGDKNVLVVVLVDQEAAAGANISPCISSSLGLGMTVQTTVKVSGWMLPNKTQQSFEGNPIKTYKAGQKLHLIQGPLCNELGTWWRVSLYFSFVDGQGETINTETVSWVQEQVDGVSTLSPVGNAIENISYALDDTIAQAQSVLGFQGQRVWNIPSVYGFRVGVLKRGDGPIEVKGRNESTTFFLVVLKDGTQGWICSHLSNYTSKATQTEIKDHTAEPCYVPKAVG